MLQTAQVVIVGWHHSEDRWSTRLGPVPSAIMHRSPCPVVVVEELHPASPADDGGVLAVDFARDVASRDARVAGAAAP